MAPVFSFYDIYWHDWFSVCAVCGSGKDTRPVKNSIMCRTCHVSSLCSFDQIHDNNSHNTETQTDIKVHSPLT